MSIARHPRRSRRSFILAAAAILGVGLGASLAAVTPADAGRLQLTARQAKHPRKTVKLPTRPSPRANGVRADRVQARPGRGNADRVQARPGRGHADRVRARPGRYRQPQPRIRDFRIQRSRRGS